MKKINFIIFALFVSLFSSSCEDAIDIVQPGELTPAVAFQTVEDLQLGLNGVYSSISGEGPIAFSTVFTDEVAIGFANGGQGLNGGEYVFNLNTGSRSVMPRRRTNSTAKASGLLVQIAVAKPVLRSASTAATTPG